MSDKEVDLKQIGKFTSNSQNLTVDKVKRYLPKGTNRVVTQEIVDLMLKAEEDTGLNQDYLEEQFLANMDILNGSTCDMAEYINAVKYVALKQHMSNSKAWGIVFPDRYDRLVKLREERAKEGRENSVNIESHVSSYNKTVLVIELERKMFVADHLQYAPLRHFAIKKQYELACGKDADGRPVSANVQHLATSKLYDMVKMPEDNSLELKIGMSDDAKKVQTDLIEQLAANAEIQRQRLLRGDSIEDVQQVGVIIEG